MQARFSIPSLTAALLISAFSLICEAADLDKSIIQGTSKVDVTGELKQWHKVSLTLDGPFATEMDNEENTQSSDEVREMVKFLHDTDPYQHHIVLHTFPPEQEKVYRPLLGNKSLLTGVSLQNSWKQAHQRTLQWPRESTAAGRPWVVANDEQNPAGLGVPPDPGYKGYDGIAVEKQPKGSKAEGDFTAKPYTLHDIRKLTLWGNLMAGGAGVEYYFGYALPENDLIAQDFRSRDQSWDYCRIALDSSISPNSPPKQPLTSGSLKVGNPAR